MVKELQRRQYLKRVLYSYPSLALLTVLTFFIVKGAFGIVMIERDSAGRVGELEEQSAALNLREDKLEEEIARLQSEEGIVEAIKDKFSVTREGEYVAIIVDERTKATTTDELSQIWYERLWNAIIGR